MEISSKFRARMLGYRCRNIAKVAESRFDLPCFASPIRILARVLGASIVDSAEVQAGLGPLLRKYDERIQASRWSDPRCVVLEGLLFHYHEKPGQKLHVGTLTATANDILVARREKAQLEAREVGSVLRLLELLAKRDRAGYALRLDESVGREIHRLAYQFEVASVQSGMLRCSHCAAIFGFELEALESKKGTGE